jgi:hypothetical protein
MTDLDFLDRFLTTDPPTPDGETLTPPDAVEAVYAYLQQREGVLEPDPWRTFAIAAAWVRWRGHGPYRNPLNA